MTAPTQNNQVNAQTNVQPTEKSNDKELNFRALEAKLAQERSARLEAEKARLEAEKKAQEAFGRNNRIQEDEEDQDNEPYVDHKKLRKEQAKFGQQIKQQTQAEIKQAVSQALAEERQQNWLRSNSDFYDVMQHAEKFAQQDPELAETILQMPEGFERQKLVYRNIKALGLHKPSIKEPSIQDKIDANKRSPYYQPSGVANAPYSSAGDFSPAGQKNAFNKMQELKNRLRLG